MWSGAESAWCMSRLHNVELEPGQIVQTDVLALPAHEARPRIQAYTWQRPLSEGLAPSDCQVEIQRLFKVGKCSGFHPGASRSKPKIGAKNVTNSWSVVCEIGSLRT